MQENTKTSKWTKLRLKRNSRNFIMSACWEPVVNFVLLLQMRGSKKIPSRSSGTSRFSCWALTNSLFQAIYCINQLYLWKISMINKKQEFTSEKAHIKKPKGGSESLKTNFGSSSHTSVNLEPNAQASEQSNNVKENKLSVRDTLKAHLPYGQGSSKSSSN